MKVLLSWLREFVDVTASPVEIAALMGVRGFAVEGIEPAGGDDYVLDFEVTANRPDCMSVVGIAREVATAYGLGIGDLGVGVWDLGVGVRDWGLGISDSPTSATAQSLIPNPQSPIPNPQSLQIFIDAPDLCPRY